MRKPVAGTAADPTVQYSDLEIDGEHYRLAYDFNAIANAEQVAGCNLLQGLSGFLNNVQSATAYRGLLYAAMLKAQPDTTIEKAGSLVRIDTMADIKMALVMAYRLSMPEKKRAMLVWEVPAPAA